MEVLTDCSCLLGQLENTFWKLQVSSQSFEFLSYVLKEGSLVIFTTWAAYESQHWSCNNRRWDFLTHQECYICLMYHCCTLKLPAMSEFPSTSSVTRPALTKERFLVWWASIDFMLIPSTFANIIQFGASTGISVFSSSEMWLNESLCVEKPSKSPWNPSETWNWKTGAETSTSHNPYNSHSLLLTF